MSRTEAVQSNTWGNQSFAAGQLEAARDAYQRAIEQLEPDDQELLADLYENLALARLNLGQLDAALRAFLRALDGEPSSRQQSLRYLIVCCLGLSRYEDAQRYLQIYEQSFGKHPDAQPGSLRSLTERARLGRSLWQPT